jgi:hypothetical protein
MRNLMWFWVASAVVLVMALWGAHPASAAGLAPGTTAPMLGVKIVAGVDAGQSYCAVCHQGLKPEALIFLNTTGGMVPQFLPQLEHDIAGLDSPELRVFVIFTGAAAKDEAAIRNLAEQARIAHVSLAVPTDPKEWPAWKLQDTETNAYCLNQHKIVKSLAAGCPKCDNVAQTITTALKANP